MLFGLSFLLMIASFATCCFGVQHEIDKIPVETRARMGDTDWVGVEWIGRGMIIFIGAALAGFASVTLWIIQRRRIAQRSAL